MTQTQEITGTLNASDGSKLFFRAYKAESQKAGVVIAHGLGDHGGRYGNVVEQLLPRGYSVWLPDHRGHGKSEGPRGHVDRFYQYVDDLHHTVKLARSQMAPGQTLLLFGHSMGGLIVTRFALLYPEMIDGVIASSPAMGMAKKVPFIKSLLGKMMSKLKPEMSMTSGLDKEKISHDAEAVKDYLSDPLVHHQVTARWFTEFVAAMENVEMYAFKLHQPFLFLIAGEDYMVSPQSSKEIFSKIGSSDKTMKFYDGLWHRLFDESKAERDMVLEDLVTWLEQRMAET